MLPKKHNAICGQESPMKGKPCPNPYEKQNEERMKKRGAKWVYIAARPAYKYNYLGFPEYSHMETFAPYKKK